ncbi:MAG TPA: 2-succinyl-6-hydroxy-2,4-cyclohexadiene-1-carboxylate synthase [Candidatus Eisenbacteria bacterium]|nr:2-succinyl-6-hydroxy-2,4-cyclohexadiene-1-carboxylate synthase [Candidatus Eisenbacteria bacterium]
MTSAPPNAPAARLEPRTIEARGLDYRVRVAGDEGAPLVLLLHGFAGSGDDWSAHAAALLAAGYRAAAVDLPGHGETPAPRTHPLARYAPAETGRDLAAILDALAAGAAHWVGYSMGGRIALAAALDRPERVTSLTLEGVSAGIADPAEREERRRADEALADAIESRGAAWFAEAWAALPIFESQRALPPSLRDDLAARRRRNDPAGLADSLRAAGQGVQPFLGARLAAFDRPTLLVTGALDAKYTTLAAAIAAALPAGLHVAIPGAGHNVHLEQPEWYRRTLLTHLRRHGGACGAGAAPAAPSNP